MKKNFTFRFISFNFSNSSKYIKYITSIQFLWKIISNAFMRRSKHDAIT